MKKRKRGGKKKKLRYRHELAKFTKSEIARIRAMRDALDKIARDMALKTISAR